MIPLIPVLIGAGLAALFFGSKSGAAATPSPAGENDLLAEGARWRQAALGTIPPSAAVATAVLSQAAWVRDGDWAAAAGKLYYRVG